MEAASCLSMDGPWTSINVDDGAVTLTVKTCHLEDFPTFMRNLTKKKLGFDTGFVKVIIEDLEEGASLDQLCLFARKLFQKKAEEEGIVSQQVFHHGSETHHVYKISSKNATTSQLTSFINEATNPAAYTTISKCCEEAMCRSKENLRSHFWKEIRERSNPSYVMRPGLSKAAFQNLLMKGATDRKIFHQHSPDPETCDVEDSQPRSPLKKRKQGARPKSILYCQGMPVEEEEFPVCRGFSLSHLHTILDLCNSDIPGVTSPFMYFGHPHATFPWHVEDMGLFSVNWLHFGAPCLWNFVSPKDYSIFAESMKLMPLDPGDTACGFALVHKFLLADQQYLQSFGIKVHSTLQNQRELIITYPYAAHSGHRLGLSVSQAVNFADPFWVEVGVLAPPCACVLSQVNFTNFNMKHILSCSRPDLLQMYLANDFIGLAKKLRTHEFVKMLKLVPEHLSGSMVDDADMNSLPVHNEVESCVSSATEESEDYTHNQSRESCDDVPETPRFRGARYLLQCPACNQTYTGGRGRLHRLVDHVKKKHPNRPELEHLVQERNPSKILKTFHVCPVCNQKKGGDLYHLKLHIANMHPEYQVS